MQPSSPHAAPDGRERARRALWAAVSSFAVRGLSAGAALVSVPLTVAHVGAEGFGAWLTLSSVVSMLVFADGGIGNTLVNDLADRRARGAANECPAIVASGLLVVLLATPCVLLAALSWAWAGGAARLLGPDSTALATEAGWSAALLALLFAVNLALSPAQAVLRALQRTHVANLAQCVGTVAGLATLVLAVRCDAPLRFLVAALYSGTVYASVASWFAAFRGEGAFCRPRAELARVEIARGLFRRGVRFVYLQFASMAIPHLPLLVVTWAAGAETAAGTGSCIRLFGTVGALAGACIAPLWPAFRDAVSRGEWEWVRRTLRLAAALGGAACLVAGVAAHFAAGPLSEHWLRGAVRLEPVMLSGFAFLLAGQVLVSPYVMLMNAQERMRPQVLASLAYLAGVVPVALLCVRHEALPLLPWGLGVLFLATHTLPFWWLARRAQTEEDVRV